MPRRSCSDSLWLTYVIWRHKSVFTLAKLMSYLLMALCHYRNQCRPPINEILWRSPGRNLIASTQVTILHNGFEDYITKIAATSPRCHWVNANQGYIEHYNAQPCTSSTGKTYHIQTTLSPMGRTANRVDREIKQDNFCSRHLKDYRRSRQEL